MKMIKLFWQTLKVTPLVLTVSLLAASNANAQVKSAEKEGVDNTLEQINNYQQMGQNDSQSQVTNVNQLRDVSPTDWAYEALRSLVDRYGCIVGFPNQTYRGNQALSRYEFAAGLNSCLNQIERLIASQVTVIQEDIDKLNRLAQEFEAELAVLGGRVDELEARTAFLEDHQFSITTKLKGEVIFALSDTFGKVDGSDPTETTWSDRVRLNFDTSFTGKDRLRTRLQAGNVPQYQDDPNEGGVGYDAARLGFDVNNDNNIEIDDLYYQTRLYDDKIEFYVGTNGLNINNIFDVYNPVLASGGTGALSRFNRRDPIIYRGSDGAGIGAGFKFLNDQISFKALYLADDETSSSPQSGEGIFNGSYSTGAQIGLEPIDGLGVGIVYLRSFQTEGNVSLSGEAGTDLARNPFGIFDDDGNIVDSNDVSADKVGLSASYDVGQWNFGLSGGVAWAKERNVGNKATLFDVSGSVAYLDLLKEGSALSIAGGIVPKVVKNENANGEDGSTPYIIEGLYKFPLNDNIIITPGAYVLINPNGDNDNNTLWATTLRTTFEF